VFRSGDERVCKGLVSPAPHPPTGTEISRRLIYLLDIKQLRNEVHLQPLEGRVKATGNSSNGKSGSQGPCSPCEVSHSI
jgi:hypothetical protein